MEYKRLGKTDLKVSIIGLGCEGFMNKSDDEVKVLVDKAHQEGINFIDFFSSNPQGRREQAGSFPSDRRSGEESGSHA